MDVFESLEADSEEIHKVPMSIDKSSVEIEEEPMSKSSDSSLYGVSPFRALATGFLTMKDYMIGGRSSHSSESDSLTANYEELRGRVSQLEAELEDYKAENARLRKFIKVNIPMGLHSLLKDDKTGYHPKQKSTISLKNVEMKDKSEEHKEEVKSEMYIKEEVKSEVRSEVYIKEEGEGSYTKEEIHTVEESIEIVKEVEESKDYLQSLKPTYEELIELNKALLERIEMLESQ